jgi:hypothetical protein
MTAVPSNSVLVDFGGPNGFVAVPQRFRDAILARLFSRRLDARLASGEAPEKSRLLAVRAVQLTSPRTRRHVARCWDELAARARYPQPFFDARAPVARSQIDAAADEIGRIAELLRAPRPVSAQGVALAAGLLTMAGSPAYRPGRGGDELAAAIARALDRF